MNFAQAVALLLSLKAQLVVLENELATLQNASSSAQVSSIPIGFVPWTPSSTWHYSNPDTNTASDDPMTLGAAEPTSTLETMASVQLSGNDGQTLSNGTPLFTTGIVNTNVCLVIFDQNGDPITDSSATITTDSLTNSQNPDGSWSFLGSYDSPVSETYNFAVPNYSCSYVASTDAKGSATYASALGYNFRYDPPSDGSHEITVSALGSTQSVTIESTSSGQ